MFCRSSGNRRILPFASALLTLLLAAAPASAADILVTSAKIEAGKLVITGTTTLGGMRVRLDGQTAAAFNVMSNATTRAFAFNVVYHPGDCIVALQKLTPPATLGAATFAVVAGCGPRSLVPRGAWIATIPYLTNDLVAWLGSSWIARRDSLGKLPTMNPTYWEKFASKGDTGAAGARGTQGPSGLQGLQGATGLQGTQGPQGPAGPGGILQTARLSGEPDPLGPGVATRFIGPVADIALTAGQRFTGFVTVPVTSSGTTLEVDLCYRLEGAEMQPFGGLGGGTVMIVTSPTMLAVASTAAPGASGDYQVGLCAINAIGATTSFNALSGWIQVTN
jgi:hypothetical protein